MENKQEIGVNESSGAQKVENIGEQVKKEQRQAQLRIERAQKRVEQKKARAERRKAEERALLEKQEERRRQREEKRGDDKRHDNKGNGGWIAAVSILGVLTLGLATTVTVGAIDMKRTKAGVSDAYRSTTYEIVGIMENVDNDLDRVRISNTPAQQSRILTDLLVQARLAELDLEKMPIEAQANRNLTSYINRVATACEGMLAKLRNGEALSERDAQTLASLYATGHEARGMMQEYIGKMQDKDITDYIKKGMGAFKDTLDKLEKATLQENRMTFAENKGGAGTDSKDKKPEQMPKPQPREKEEGIGTAKAEELCMDYFAEYKAQSFQCVGETVSRGVKAYNVQGYDARGVMIFAEVDRNSGELVRFDYHETCMDKKFDTHNAKQIAENFLEKLGYDDMEAVRVRENGAEIDFTFVYSDDGVAYYPDTVKVKVCLSRGVVTAMDASEYLRCHKEREEPMVTLNMAQAKAKLHKDLSVETARLAVVKTARGERGAYEFLCSYEGERYFVYLDAINGNEIAIVNVRTVG